MDARASSARGISAAAVAVIGLGIALSLALVACTPNGQSVTRSTASAKGTTLHLSIVDDFGVMIGGGILGGMESGFDRLDGDLPQVAEGTWRGVVTGTTTRDIVTIVLDDKCETQLAGTQRIQVTATRGTYAEGRNLRLTLTPVGPPSYSKKPECDQSPVKQRASNGIEWLEFYFDAYRGEGMDVRLPRAPGGTWRWEYAPNPNPGYPANCGLPGLAECGHTTTLTVEYR